MQEEVKILLEWFLANGITELFSDTARDSIRDNNYESDNKINTIDKSNTSSVVKEFIKRQDEIKEMNIVNNNQVRDLADKINKIDDILDTIKNTEIYRNFRKTATSTIIIDGNLESDILIINDLPNDEDDISGNIFSGESGELLRKMMNAIELSEEKYCILNSFFWRLPGNRNPIKEEMNLCKPFVEKIISLIKPKLIIFMGSYAISTIFEENKTILSLHGKFFDYTNCYLQNNIKITGVYGPHFLWKNPSKKRDAWNDLKKVKEFLES